MVKIIMNTQKSETKESPKFVLKVSQRLHLKHANKHFALQNYLFITHGKIQESSIRTVNLK